MSNIAKDVFKDYNKQSSILNCIINNINLYKKSKKLSIELLSENKINVIELAEFEEYLEQKLSIKKIEFNITYSSKIAFTIEKDWHDIINYITFKMPITKQMIEDSNIRLDGETTYIILKTRSLEFLKSYKFDKALEKLVLNLYGKKYNIKYEENIDTTEEQKQNEFLEEIRKKECKKAIAEQKEQFEKNKILKKLQKEELKEKNVENEKINKDNLIFGKGKKIEKILSKISEINEDSGKVVIKGKVIEYSIKEKEDKISIRKLKNSKKYSSMAMFNLYDGTGTVTCKVFLKENQEDEVLQKLKEAQNVEIQGIVKNDDFLKEIGIIASIIIEIPENEFTKRKDLSEEKRVELHMHTKMSQMDGISTATDLIKRAALWGMKSIAITDHGVVQSFPEAKKAADKLGIKVIYGVEAYLVPDENAVDFSKGFDEEYCVIDIETTGLSFRTEKITEIGAVKVKNGEIIDTFECFVNPETLIPERITELTGITDEMVKDAETINQVMPKFLKFIGDLKLVAHNADFDIGFLKYNAENLGLNMDNEYLDTLALSRQLFPEFRKHKLGIIAENLGIKAENEHRALDDVITLVKVFQKMLETSQGKNEVSKSDKKKKNKEEKELYKTLPSYHAIILVKDLKGLRNLYKLISISHLNYFYKKPRILTSIYNKYKEGLILRKCL